MFFFFSSIYKKSALYLISLFTQKIPLMRYISKKLLLQLTAPIILALIFLLPACNKDKATNATSAIDGTYNFKSTSAVTESSITGNAGDKAITRSNYTTNNNGGTLTFSNGNLTAKGLTYTINSQASAYEYLNGTLIDSVSYPFNFTLQPSNYTGQYQLVGSDSIYFPQGGITVAVDGSATYQGQPGGGHYSISGNILTITQYASKDSSFTNSGESYLVHESGVATIKLEKQ